MVVCWLLWVNLGVWLVSFLVVGWWLGCLLVVCGSCCVGFGLGVCFWWCRL